MPCGCAAPGRAGQEQVGRPSVALSQQRRQAVEMQYGFMDDGVAIMCGTESVYYQWCGHSLLLKPEASVRNTVMFQQKP